MYIFNIYCFCCSFCLVTEVLYSSAVMSSNLWRTSPDIAYTTLCGTLNCMVHIHSWVSTMLPSYQDACICRCAVVTLYATLGEEAVIHGISETECSIVITSSELLPKFKVPESVCCHCMAW